MIIYEDHLESALILATDALEAKEKAAGYTQASCFLAVLQDARKAMREGERVEVHSRS